MSEHKRVFEELAEARANLKKASDKAYDLINELVKSPIGIKEPTVTGLLLGYWANGSWDEGDGEDPGSLAKAKSWVEHGSFLSENDKNK